MPTLKYNNNNKKKIMNIIFCSGNKYNGGDVHNENFNAN